MQQVPGCCCVSAGSGEAAGTGQRCLRTAKGLPPPPPPLPPLAEPPGTALCAVLPECRPLSMPGGRRRNPSSVSWPLTKDLGELFRDAAGGHFVLQTVSAALRPCHSMTSGLG